MKLTREQMQHILDKKTVNTGWSNDQNLVYSLDIGMGKYQSVTWADFKEYIDTLESRCITLAMLVADKISSGELK